MSPSHPRHSGRFMLFSRLAAFLLLAATSRAVLSDDIPPPAKPSVLDRAPSERARRDAEKVFHWIKIHADKPRKAAAVAVEKPALAAPAKVADKPAPKPADSGISETVEPIRPPMAKVARPVPAPVQPVSTPADNVAAAASSPARAAMPPVTPVEAVEAVASARQAVAEVPPAVDEEPEQVDLVPIRQDEPEFPASLMRRLRKGLVKVSFTVLPDGSVAQPQAVSSSHSRLEPTALATVSKWRFQPVRHPQEAVVELGFDLD